MAYASGPIALALKVRLLETCIDNSWHHPETQGPTTNGKVKQVTMCDQTENLITSCQQKC